MTTRYADDATIAEIESLRQQLATVTTERDALKRKAELPMKYKRMEYNAQLQEQLATVTKQRDELVAALNQFAECDLNESNCANLEVATRRIRAVAKAALAKVGADKTGEV